MQEIGIWSSDKTNQISFAEGTKFVGIEFATPNGIIV